VSNVFRGRVIKRDSRYPFRRTKQENSNVQIGRSSRISWLTIITAFISLSTTALVLLGYGYSLAVESVFGINAELVGNSVGDYLRFSTYVIAGFMQALSTKTFQLDFYSRLYRDNKAWIITLGVLWIVVGIVWFFYSGQASKRKLQIKVEKFCTRIVPKRLQPALRVMFSWLRFFLGKLFPKEFVIWLGGLFGIAALPLITVGARLKVTSGAR
jgi:hypothetical protein